MQHSLPSFSFLAGLCSTSQEVSPLIKSNVGKWFAKPYRSALSWLVSQASYRTLATWSNTVGTPAQISLVLPDAHRNVHIQCHPLDRWVRHRNLPLLDIDGYYRSRSWAAAAWNWRRFCTRGGLEQAISGPVTEDSTYMNQSRSLNSCLDEALLMHLCHRC